MPGVTTSQSSSRPTSPSAVRRFAAFFTGSASVPSTPSGSPPSSPTGSRRRKSPEDSSRTPTPISPAETNPGPLAEIIPNPSQELLSYLGLSDLSWHSLRPTDTEIHVYQSAFYGTKTVLGEMENLFTSPQITEAQKKAIFVITMCCTIAGFKENNTVTSKTQRLMLMQRILTYAKSMTTTIGSRERDAVRPQIEQSHDLGWCKTTGTFSEPVNAADSSIPMP